MRDVETYAQKGRETINKIHRKDITSGELDQLYQMTKRAGSQGGLFKALVNAFYFGVAVGSVKR